MKIVQLEQELVRAEAQSLVAEAQLTNITRQKFKEAYDIHTAAIIERAEKQILLARNARKLVNLLDDTPVVPGDIHPTFENAEEAREVLNSAEKELRMWEMNVEPIHSNAGSLGAGAMPGHSLQNSPEQSRSQTLSLEEQQQLEMDQEAQQQQHGEPVAVPQSTA